MLLCPAGGEGLNPRAYLDTTRFFFLLSYLGIYLEMVPGLFPHQGEDPNAIIESAIYNLYLRNKAVRTSYSLQQLLARDPPEPLWLWAAPSFLAPCNAWRRPQASRWWT